MGIKRCPSFSKRPGFPCGLRVLLVDGDAAARTQSEALLQECAYEVTLCASVAEATAKLNGPCGFDVLLADKPSLSAAPPAAQAALFDAASGLPTILMGSAPQPADVMQGLELGAVDFLDKPLAPQKLRNIWQHTVRKMMCNMSIECAGGGADGVPLPPLPVGKERVSMDVIPEEAEAEEAARAAAGTTPRSSTSTPPGSSVINYANAPNMALAITSSFYGPSSGAAAATAAPQLDRSGSSAAETRCASPGSPDSRPAKQQHCSHGPVRACPSTRSLNSMSSCQSAWALPASPSTPSLARLASDATGAAAAAAAPEGDSCMADGACADKATCAQRCMRKAVRHPAAAAASPVSACKPPLCGKPAAAAAGTPVSGRAQPAAAAQQQQQQPSGAPVPAAPALAAVPLPTGLGPLPQGMVWGMPMVPLVRAPGIVPPASATPATPPLAAGVAALPLPPPAWSMCAPPASMFMGYGGMAMMHAGASPYGMMQPGMPYVDAAAAMQASAYAASAAQHYSSACMQQQQQTAMVAEHIAQQPQQQQQATGAAAAAALGGLDLLGGSSAAAAQSCMDADEEEAALDFVLGDMAAEDDCVVAGVCGSLLDADMSALDEGGLALPAQVPAAMPALEAELQHHASVRASFDCSVAALPHHSRPSFDCSSASTATGVAARASFETSHCCPAARAATPQHGGRVSFEVSQLSRCNSTRASFEVASMQQHHAAAAQQQQQPACVAAAAVSKMASATSAPPALLGSMSDLFGCGAAGAGATALPGACSDESSQGSGSALPRVDSCGVLADLQSLFAASGGDSGCAADGVDSAMDGEELFVDALDDVPLGVAMRKSSSLAQLINAGLPASA